MKVVVNVDGGARGNPGPAAIGVVVSEPDGTVIDEVAERIGVATNNVAEYRAVLKGIERAQALAALSGFDRWRIRTVPRAQNARADELVNAALDGPG